MTLTSRELAGVHTVIDPTHAQEPGPVVPWTLLQALSDLVGADEVELDETDPARGSMGYLQSVSGRAFTVGEPDDPHFWDLWRSSLACQHCQGAHARSVVTMPSDVVSLRQWRADPMYVDYASQSGFLYEMGINIPTRVGALRLHCRRGPGRGFGEKERFYLTLLRPHLVEAYAAAITRRSTALLTARQLQLLDHVAAGLTNRQIGRRMDIAEGTVRRHLNDIYERLGVNSRTAAVTAVASPSFQTSSVGAAAAPPT